MVHQGDQGQEDGEEKTPLDEDPVLSRPQEGECQERPETEEVKKDDSLLPLFQHLAAPEEEETRHGRQEEEKERGVPEEREGVVHPPRLEEEALSQDIPVGGPLDVVQEPPVGTDGSSVKPVGDLTLKSGEV